VSGPAAPDRADAGPAPGRPPGVGALAAGARVVAEVATMLLVALVATEIVARAVFRTSTLLADEFAGYLLVALAFAGLADSLRSGTFIRVELLAGRLPASWRDPWATALRAVALVYTAYLAYHAWLFVADTYRLGTRSVHFSQTPLWMPRALMAAGLSALALELAAGLLRARRRGPPGDP
jgi:TRAP-type C4-dicarboxylate transport system permease small subunit